METTIVPAHKEGKQNDLSETKTLQSIEEAVDCFNRGSKRMLNPEVWFSIGGIPGGEVKLIDSEGNEPRRLAQEGDLYRIDLPGPGPKAGSGYDWVKLDAIEDKKGDQLDEQLFAIRLVPAMNPYHETPTTAHFFKEGASSNFVVKRTGTTVTAEYHGRNEVLNNDTASTLDNIRNTVMGTAGLLGLSDLQWKSMIKALLEAELGG